MNLSDSFNSSNKSIDQPLLDHFVEGELTEAYEREVLLRLDAEPGGWRRLALTFVEAQRWGREFRALAAEADVGPVGNVSHDASTPRRRSRIRLWMVAAGGLAAAFLVGLALGGLTWDWRGSNGDMAGTSQRPAGAPSEAVLPRGTDADAEGRPAILRLAFLQPGSDTPRYVEVPVVEASEVPAGLLENPPPAIPSGLKRFLEQSGFEVVQRACAQPIQLSDGRRLDLLGSQTQVRYVGRMVQ